MAEELIEPPATTSTLVRDEVTPPPATEAAPRAVSRPDDEAPDAVAAPLFGGGGRSRPLTITLTPATLVGLFVAALVLILLVVALTYLANFLLTFFLGVTLGLGLLPAVQWLMRRGLGRGPATLLTHLGLVLGMGLGLFFIISPLVEEMAALKQEAPTLLDQAYDRLPEPVQERVDPFIEAAQAARPTPAPAPGGVITSTTAVGGATITSTTSVSTAAGQGEPDGGFSTLLSGVDLNALLKTIVGWIASAVITLIGALIVSCYWVLGEDKPQRVFLSTVPPHFRAYAATVLAEFATSLGGYLRGEMLLCLSIGVMTYVGLLLIGMPFALMLAVLAGVLEIVPNLGPLLSEIPAIIIGFAVGGIELAFWVFVLYSIIQNIEGAWLAPRVMGKAVRIPGLLVFLAVISWGTLFGFLGAVLAVPLTALLVGGFRRLLLPYLQQRAAAARAATAA